jgi:hypothetical protein
MHSHSFAFGSCCSGAFAVIYLLFPSITRVMLAIAGYIFTSGVFSEGAFYVAHQLLFISQDEIYKK